MMSMISYVWKRETRLSDKEILDGKWELALLYENLIEVIDQDWEIQGDGLEEVLSKNNVAIYCDLLH